MPVFEQVHLSYEKLSMKNCHREIARVTSALISRNKASISMKVPANIASFVCPIFGKSKKRTLFQKTGECRCKYQSIRFFDMTSRDLRFRTLISMPMLQRMSYLAKSCLQITAKQCNWTIVAAQCYRYQSCHANRSSVLTEKPHRQPR